MSAKGRLGTLTPADRTAGIGLLLVLLGVYLATFAGLPGNPDAEVEYQTTRSLARGEGYAISNATPEGAAIIATRFDVREGVDGRFYSWFGIGQAWAAVPLYWGGAGLARLFGDLEARHAATLAYGAPRSEYFPHLVVGLRNPILGALTGWLLFLIARRLGVGRRAATISALGYGLATFAWPQARDSLSDVQATFFSTAALALLTTIRVGFDGLRPPSRWALLGLGAALGAMVLTRVVTAPLAVAYAVALLVVVVRGRQRMWSMPLLGGEAGIQRAARDLVWFAVPALAAAVLLLLSNANRFGDPFETGYSDAVASGTFFSYPPWLGLLGVTIAPGKGLLWHAPLVLLAAVGLPRLWRDRFLIVLLAAGVLAVFLPPIHTQTFHGAWTYGPRYILPALPMLWLAVAWGVESLERTRASLVVWALGGVGLVSALGGVLTDQSTFHSLALDAARVEWPDVADETELAADDQRFVNVQWDWRFAAPWAHWRIFRHRAAGLPENFPSDQIFFLDERVLLSPTHERDRGFRHLAWVDLEQRLRGPVWPGLLLAALLAAVGVAQLVRGFDPTQH
ncbi:MAG: hypothetical protein AAFZ65_07615 [Planctomycetota bacterium]